MSGQDQDEVTRTVAIQRIARVIIHAPNAGDELRQTARDTAVSAHTVLRRLQGGGA